MRSRSRGARFGRYLVHRLGTRCRARRRRVARLLAEEARVPAGAWLDHHVKEAKLEVGWDARRGLVSYHAIRTEGAHCCSPRRRRAGTSPQLGADARVRPRRPGVSRGAARRRHAVGYGGQVALGALTVDRAARGAPPPRPARARAVLRVVCFATVGEVIGSLVW